MLSKTDYAKVTQGGSDKAKIAAATTERENSTATMRRNTAKKRASLYRGVCQQIEEQTRKACSGNLVAEVAETKGKDYGQGDKVFGPSLGRVAGLSVALFGNANDATVYATAAGFFGKTDAELLDAGDRLARLNNSRKFFDTLKAHDSITTEEYGHAASYDSLRELATGETLADDFTRQMFSQATGLALEQATSDVIKAVRERINEIKAENRAANLRNKQQGVKERVNNKLGRDAFLALIGMTPKVMTATAGATGAPQTGENPAAGDIVTDSNQGGEQIAA